MKTKLQMSSGNGQSKKELMRHIQACHKEIERLTTKLELAVECIEKYTLPNLSAASLLQWFQLYIRLVDFSVEIRRGEIRHQTSRSISFKCMHTTGKKTALHTGLSVDDANAIYQMLEDLNVKESKLERLFMQTDLLDNDRLGSLESRISECANKMEILKSSSYSSFELKRTDPHQEILVFSSEKSSSCVAKAGRKCFNPSSCSCSKDFCLWEKFDIQPTTNTQQDKRKRKSHRILDEDEEETDQKVEVGMLELKKQFGFEPEVRNDDDDDDEEEEDKENSRLKKKRSIHQPIKTAASIVFSPQEIYLNWCRNNRLHQQKKLLDLFRSFSTKRKTDKEGLDLNLKGFGLSSVESMEAITHVLSKTEMPIRMLDISDNIFSFDSLEFLLELLVLPNVQGNLENVNMRCVSLPTRDDYARILKTLRKSHNPVQENQVQNKTKPLKSLNLSYNTLEGSMKELVQLLDERIRSGLSPLTSLVLAGCFVSNNDTRSSDEIEDLSSLLMKCAQGSTCLDLSDCELSTVNLNNNSESKDEAENEADEVCLEELRLENINLGLNSSSLYRSILYDSMTGRLKSLSLSFSSSTTSESMSSLWEYLASILDQEDCHLDQLYLRIPRTSISVHQRLINSITNYGKLQVLGLTMSLSIQRQEHSNQAEMPLDRHLLSGGMELCRSLTICNVQLTSMIDLWCILAESQLPQMEKMRISINISDVSDEKETYLENAKRFFTEAAPALEELYLELTEVPSDFEEVLRKGWQSKNENATGEITRYTPRLPFRVAFHVKR